MRREEGSGNDTEDDTERVKISAILLKQTSAKQSYNSVGVITLVENTEASLHLAGVNMARIERIKFTTATNTYGGACSDTGDAHYQSKEIVIASDNTVHLPTGLAYHREDHTYYLCVKEEGREEFLHQGEEKYLQMEIIPVFLPSWMMIILLVILLILSGLFSGLNLGLMSLDQTELKIVMNTGTAREKSYAKVGQYLNPYIEGCDLQTIIPIRGMGNFLLCSILLGNVLVNNSLTILLDSLTGGGGTVAVICATLGIVVFGEIIPQSICSRHGLAVGAKTIWLTKFFMFITSPLSFPISKVLDMILGSEIGTVYNKERLMELLKVTDQYNDLEKDEVNIVTGALALKEKTVKDVMTHLEDCYMLPLSSVLNFKTVSDIKDQGYSRIPVYDGEKTNIVHILFTKDLLFVDPDDDKPLAEVCKFYNNEVNFVYDDTNLTDMFDEFKSGEKGHMAVVTEVKCEGDGDPFHEIIGLVTIEDIIEEIIQQEIIDETDVIIDNKSKKKRKSSRYKKNEELKMFLLNKNHHCMMISPQMSLAILQFLTTSVKAFGPDNCSKSILQKLLRMDVYRQIRISKTRGTITSKKDGQPNLDDEDLFIMKMGEPCDFFVLILEGHVEVTIGREEHKFQEGPFRCFGEQMLEEALTFSSSSSFAGGQTNKKTQPSQSLSPSSVNEGQGYKFVGKQQGITSCVRRTSTDVKKSNSWVPDYSVQAVSDVLYLKIRKSTYMVAVNATKMNKDQMKDEDIDNIFAVKIGRSEGDLVRRSSPNLLSPDIMWEDGIVNSMKGTPTDSRRLSTRSSASYKKTSLCGGVSNSSIDRKIIIDTPDIALAFDNTEHRSLLGKENDMDEINENSASHINENERMEAPNINIVSERDIFMENAVT